MGKLFSRVSDSWSKAEMLGEARARKVDNLVTELLCEWMKIVSEWKWVRYWPTSNFVQENDVVKTRVQQKAGLGNNVVGMEAGGLETGKEEVRWLRDGLATPCCYQVLPEDGVDSGFVSMNLLNTCFVPGAVSVLAYAVLTITLLIEKWVTCGHSP